MTNVCRRAGVAMAVLVAATSFGGSARAEGEAAGDDSAVVEDLVDILCGKGELSPERCTELYRKLGREEPVSLAEVSEEPPTWDFRWSNGFKLDRSDGMFKLGFGGRIMLDIAYVDFNRNAELIATALDPPLEDGFGDEFRRVRIYFEGELYERLLFKLQVDFAGGDVDFNDVYLGLVLPWDSRLIVGHQKEPYSLEQTESSKYITFMERALPVEAFGPTEGRNTGFELETAHERWYAAIGFFLNSNGFGDDFPDGDNQGYQLAMRAAGTPIRSDDGTKLLHVGGSYAHAWRPGDMPTVTYSSRPEVHMTNRLVSSGALALDQIDRLGLELASVCGPLSFQSEWIGVFNSFPKEKNPEFLWGVYVYGSYFLTGESRPYNTSLAAFGRLKPKENFNPFRGGWGAWEVAARYSYVDLQDKRITGGSLWDITAGVNWYLYPNARVMLNYVYGHPFVGTLQGEMNTVEARFQVDF